MSSKSSMKKLKGLKSKRNARPIAKKQNRQNATTLNSLVKKRLRIMSTLPLLRPKQLLSRLKSARKTENVAKKNVKKPKKKLDDLEN